MKKLLQSAFLLLVLLGVAVWGWDTLVRSATAPVADASAVAAPLPETVGDQVVVTYFTTDVRCSSCVEIETMTQQSVEGRFAAEIASGRVVFQTLNLDRAENAHFADDYDLAFKTVVVSDRRDGAEASWQKLDDVWRLYRQPDAFEAYVASAIEKMLGAKG